MKEVIQSEVAALTEGKSLHDLNQSFLEKNTSVAASKIAIGEMMLVLSSESKKEVVQLLENAVDHEKGYDALQVKSFFLHNFFLISSSTLSKNAIQIHQLFVNAIKDEAISNSFRDKCNKLFPYAVYFMNDQQKEQRQKELSKYDATNNNSSENINHNNDNASENKK